MRKPISVVIHDAGHSYFRYEHPPWYTFDEFETLARGFAQSQPKTNSSTWVEITVMFNDNFVMQCRIVLSREQNFSFSDYVGDLLYLMETDKDYEEAKEELLPVFQEIEFTIH